MKFWISDLSKQLIRFASVALFMVFIGFLYRIIFLISYADFSELGGYWADVLFSFMQGARFDIMVILYFLIPLLLFSILASVWERVFVKISQVWSSIAVILFSMLLIGDYFYYSFFGAHYNLLIFGIVDDDTQAVLKSIWTDFPVIRIVLFIILLSVLFCFVVKKIYHSKRISLIAQTKWGRYSFIVVILLTAFFLRGRLGMFPL